MSKLFETQEDLDAERAAIIRFAGFTNSIPYKLPMESMADYVLARDGYARAIVEIKCRTNKSYQYDEYMLGEKKYTALCDWSDRGFTPILLISWPDAMGYVKVPVEHKRSVGGRYDRNAPTDVENVVLIEMKHFRMLPD